MARREKLPVFRALRLKVQPDIADIIGKRPVEVNRSPGGIADRSGVRANLIAIQGKRAGAEDQAEEKAGCLWFRGLPTEEYPLVLCDAGRFEILPETEAQKYCRTESWGKLSGRLPPLHFSEPCRRGNGKKNETDFGKKSGNCGEKRLLP